MCISLRLFSHWKIGLQDFTSGKIPFPLSLFFLSLVFTLYFLLDNNLIFERLLREERKEFTTISIRILWMGNYQARGNERRLKWEDGGFASEHFLWMESHIFECVLILRWASLDGGAKRNGRPRWLHTIFGTINSRLLSFLDLHLSVLSIFPTTSLLHHLHHHSFTTLSFLICFWLIIRKSFKKSLQTHSGEEKINNTGKLTSESSLTDSSSFPLYLFFNVLSLSLYCVRREKFHKKCSKILNLFKKTYTRNNLTQTSNVGYIFKRRKRMIWKFWSFWNQV